jgi:hypothetical protein
MGEGTAVEGVDHSIPPEESAEADEYVVVWLIDGGEASDARRVVRSALIGGLQLQGCPPAAGKQHTESS